MKQIFKKALTIFIIAGSIILFIALILSGAYAEECKDCPIKTIRQDLAINYNDEQEEL